MFHAELPDSTHIIDCFDVQPIFGKIYRSECLTLFGTLNQFYIMPVFYDKRTLFTVHVRFYNIKNSRFMIFLMFSTLD